MIKKHITAKDFYNKKFYIQQTKDSKYSSMAICTYLKKFITPKNAIDIGCGDGIWIKSIKEKFNLNGVGLESEKICKVLHKQNKYIRPCDLEKKISINKFFDLLVCIEVASDLNEKRANSFIYDICQLSNVIIFSSGCPNQFHKPHKNVQWPSYWIKIFNGLGFKEIDLFRPKIWNDERMAPWFKQNLFLFVNKMEKEIIKKFKRFSSSGIPYDIVHPDLLPQSIKDKGVFEILKLIPNSILNSVKFRLK